MTWRVMLALVVLLAMTILMSACLPEDAAPDEINPVTPPDTTGDDDDDDDDPVPSGPWRAFPTHGFSTQAPSFLHIMFPVIDDTAAGVSDLELSDFYIYEDGLPISTTEGSLLLRRRSDIPYTLRTILAIDNSLSLEGDLSEIKAAANTLLTARDVDQEMMVMEFSETINWLTPDWTSDEAELRAAIEAVQVGYGGTNLYGAMNEALQSWTDEYHVTGIEQGFLIVLTDGTDTAGEFLQSDVLATRGVKRVFTLGLGDEIDEGVLDLLGNSGYYHVEDVSDLITRFDVLKDRIIEYANSFYWITYQSPKRGLVYHTLEIGTVDNSNTSNNNRRIFIDEIDASQFFGLPTGVYVNLNVDPEGIEAATADYPGPARGFRAITSMADVVPDYSWSTDNEALMNIEVDPDFPGQVLVTFNQLGEGNLIVNDNANGLAKQVFITVQPPDGNGPMGAGGVVLPEGWRTRGEEPRER